MLTSVQNASEAGEIMTKMTKSVDWRFFILN